MKSRAFKTSISLIALLLLIGCGKSGSERPNATESNPNSNVEKFASNCENIDSKFKVEDGEVSIKLKDLVTGQVGRYQLVKTAYSLTTEDLDSGRVESLKAGSSNGEDSEIYCHTAQTNESISGKMSVPVSFSTEDGSIELYRKFEFAVSYGHLTSSALTQPHTAKIGDTSQLPQSVKYLTKLDINQNVVLMVKYEVVNENQKVTIIMSSTYEK